MSYKCRVCGVYDVDEQGGVCELCSLSQDPYAMNQTPQTNMGNPGMLPRGAAGGSQPNTTKRRVLLNGTPQQGQQTPMQNQQATVNPQGTSGTKVYKSGQVQQTVQQANTVLNQQNQQNQQASQAAASKQAAHQTKGILKNVTQDEEKYPFIIRWFRTMFTGTPLSIYKDLTMFQVFPDYTGQSMNALGNACDQVIVYGNVKTGTVNENNEVEVFGFRDRGNSIVAKQIKNVASGATVNIQGIIPTALVWIVTLAILAALILFVATMGVEGIVWTIVLIICLTNLPIIFKIFAFILGIIFHMSK